MATHQISVRTDIEYGMDDELAKQLKEIGPTDTIELRFNSNGGNVFVAFSMMAQLNEHPARKHGVIEGLAASAASYLCMACDTLAIHESAFWMCHCAQSGVLGDKRDMQKMVGILDQLDHAIAGVYSSKTGISSNEFLRLMEVETWLSGRELVDAGMATLIPNKGPAGTTSAKARQSIANRAPDVRAIVNKLTSTKRQPLSPAVAAQLAERQARVDFVTAQELAWQRDENKRRIVSNAADRERGKKFLRWS